MTTTDDRATYLAERRAEMQADAPPVIPPCPSWCVSTAGLHPLDFEREGDVYVRRHEAFIGRIVTVEVTERSDGHGGTVTLSEPALLVYGEDYKGEPTTSDEAMTLASELIQGVNVRDRLAFGCPNWCREDQVDEVDGSVNHWSTSTPLLGGASDDREDGNSGSIEAWARKTPGQPMSDVAFTVYSPTTTGAAPGRRAPSPRRS